MKQSDSARGVSSARIAGTGEGDWPLEAMCLEAWPELAIAQDVIADSLRRLTGQDDPILLDAAVVRLATIQEELRSLAAGRIVFVGTEAWRAIYDQLIRSPDVDCYRSVAWMRNEDYWRDTPGQNSMRTNYDRLQEVNIERILILSDFFWPAGALLPAADIAEILLSGELTGAPARFRTRRWKLESQSLPTVTVPVPPGTTRGVPGSLPPKCSRHLLLLIGPLW